MEKQPCSRRTGNVVHPGRVLEARAGGAVRESNGQWKAEKRGKGEAGEDWPWQSVKSRINEKDRLICPQA